MYPAITPLLCSLDINGSNQLAPPSLSLPRGIVSPGNECSHGGTSSAWLMGNGGSLVMFPSAPSFLLIELLTFRLTGRLWASACHSGGQREENYRLGRVVIVLNSSEPFISLSARVGECVLVIHFMVKVLDFVKPACFTRLRYLYAFVEYWYW